MGFDIDRPLINATATDPKEVRGPASERAILYGGVSSTCEAKHFQIINDPKPNLLNDLIGRNSMLAFAVRRFRKQFPNYPLSIFCLKSMVEAEKDRKIAIGSITFTGDVLRDTTVEVSIWDAVEFTRTVKLQKGNTASDVARKVTEVFTVGSMNLPFTVGVDLATNSKVNVEASEKGENWNGYMISLDTEIPGVTYTMVTSNGGVGSFITTNMFTTADGDPTMEDAYLSHIFDKSVPKKLIGNHLENIWNYTNASISGMGYTLEQATPEEIEMTGSKLNYKEMVMWANIESQDARDVERGCVNMIPLLFLSELVARMIMFITPGTNIAKYDPQSSRPVGGVYNATRPMHKLYTDYPGPYNGKRLSITVASSLNNEGVSYFTILNRKTVTTAIKTLYKTDVNGLESTIYSTWNKTMNYIFIQRRTYSYFTSKYSNVAYTPGLIPIGPTHFFNDDVIRNDCSLLYDIISSEALAVDDPKYKSMFIEGIMQDIDYSKGILNLSNLAYKIAVQIEIVNIFFSAQSQ